MKDETAGEDLLRKLVDFCQELRTEEIPVTPSEAIDAAKSLSVTDLSDKDSVFNGLKTTLVKKSEYYTKFELLFRKFWLERKERISDETRAETAAKRSLGSRSKISPKRKADQESKGIPSTKSLFPVSDRSDSKAEPKTEEKYAYYSSIETVGKKPLEFESSQSQRVLLRRGLKAFSRKMATRPGRRFESSDVGKIDFRKALRASLRTGYLSDIPLKKKKISKSRLVFLADISGSMDVHSERLLRLIYYACNTISGTRVFGFSTRLVSLNEYVQGRSFKEAARLISEKVMIWSSGTRIGSAFEQLLTRHGECLRPSTVVVIVSDGWEIGDLDLLKARLAEIRRRVSKVVWLNPLADNLDYRPEAAGMKVSLPYVDFFAGVDVLTDRRKFEHVFGKSIHPTDQGQIGPPLFQS